MDMEFRIYRDERVSCKQQNSNMVGEPQLSLGSCIGSTASTVAVMDVIWRYPNLLTLCGSDGKTVNRADGTSHFRQE